MGERRVCKHLKGVVHDGEGDRDGVRVDEGGGRHRVVAWGQGGKQVQEHGERRAARGEELEQLGEGQALGGHEALVRLVRWEVGNKEEGMSDDTRV